MKRFGIKYHPKVKEDIKKLDKETKEKIKKSIEGKLTKAPEIFGERLKGTLKEFWKLRVGNYRVIFIVEEDTVFVLGIWHRKKAYGKLKIESLLRRLKD